MEGFWTVKFGSSAGYYGGGVVVFKNGKIAGGDAGYYYVGTYHETSPDTFSATLQVKPFIENVPSVFKGLRREFTLDLQGTVKDANHATAHGKPQDMPDLRIGLVLERREEAVAA